MDFISIDECEDLLDQIACKLPKEFYFGLDGGILLLSEEHLHSEAKEEDLYILGEYTRNLGIGQIRIYYGSIKKVYANSSKDFIKEKLEEILLHEFSHHLEHKAGLRDLEIYDEKDLDRYKKERGLK